MSCASEPDVAKFVSARRKTALRRKIGRLRDIAVHRRPDAVGKIVGTVALVDEADLLVVEAQRNVADFTITVLGDNELRRTDILSGGCHTLIVKTMNKEHHIGVLLD